jgi:hypothetical protein
MARKLTPTGVIFPSAQVHYFQLHQSTHHTHLFSHMFGIPCNQISHGVPKFSGYISTNPMQSLPTCTHCQDHIHVALVLCPTSITRLITTPKHSSRYLFPHMFRNPCNSNLKWSFKIRWLFDHISSAVIADLHLLLSSHPSSSGFMPQLQSPG